MTETTTATSGEIVERTPRAFNAEQLRAVGSFGDALDLAQSYLPKGVETPLASEELGDGFALLEKTDKDILIGQDMILLDWVFSPGDFDEEFVTVRLVTRQGGKFIVNDGGTGIRQQLREYTDRTGRLAVMRVEKGLRRSDYTKQDENGKPYAASTYYLDTSAAH